MRANEIVAQARNYERTDDLAPAEALLSVLIDLFTAGEPAEPVRPQEVQRAWELLTRDLGVPDWLLQSQALADGVDVLAGNLLEAGRLDLADSLRALHEPRFEGAVRSPELPAERLRTLGVDEPAPTERRLWVPRVGPGPLGRAT
jgi:hypothetical protein